MKIFCKRCFNAPREKRRLSREPSVGDDSITVCQMAFGHSPVRFGDGACELLESQPLCLAGGSVKSGVLNTAYLLQCSLASRAAHQQPNVLDCSRMNCCPFFWRHTACASPTLMINFGVRDGGELRCHTTPDTAARSSFRGKQ